MSRRRPLALSCRTPACATPIPTAAKISIAARREGIIIAFKHLRSPEIDVAGKNLAGAGGVGGETEDAGSALVRSSRTGEGRATSERCARMTCMCARGRCLRVPSRARSRPGGARLLRGGTRAACGRGHCGPRHRANYHSRCTTVRAMAHAQ